MKEDDSADEEADAFEPYEDWEIDDCNDADMKRVIRGKFGITQDMLKLQRCL